MTRLRQKASPWQAHWRKQYLRTDLDRTERAFRRDQWRMFGDIVLGIGVRLILPCLALYLLYLVIADARGWK